MNFCDKCFEKMWSFEHIDGWIIATCQMCGYEVEFLNKKNRNKLKKWWNKKKLKFVN
jgi:DNA-directed RNA polymerase subunit M/transcription elongation factor TFIIS